jgi:hypothetical protein
MTDPTSTSDPLERHWPAARRYLLETRFINPLLVEQGRRSGLIHAPFADTVGFYHCDPSGYLAGATHWNIPTETARRLGECRKAWFTVGNLHEAEQLIAVKSPLDALSFATLRPASAVAVVSVAGETIPSPLLAFARSNRKHLVCGLDNLAIDDFAHRQALRETETWAGFRIGQLSPQKADWSQDLLSRKGVPIHGPRTLPKHL